MIDQVELDLNGGDGGNGCISFRREKYIPHGGPNGGDGGNGGSIYLEAVEDIGTLTAYRYKHGYQAERGGHGKGKDMHGARGADLILKVPVGTVVRRASKKGVSEVVVDVVRLGERVLVAQGGRGGKGNARFASSTNQVPLLAEAGERGEEVHLVLELKLIADVGIIGKPNAGKSTLLSRVSAAKPRIANYPFTTLEPVLGVVAIDDRSFVMVEIPGLIEGAHRGAGLGYQFLRHAERTKLFLHLLDGTSPDPLKDYQQTNEELSLYDAALAKKPQVVAVNKVDVIEVKDMVPSLQAKFQKVGHQVFFISAATGEGVSTLMTELLRGVVEAKKEERNVPGMPEVVKEKVLSPRPRIAKGEVRRENDTFVVLWQRAERLAAMLNLKDWRAVAQFHRELERMGVTKALEAKGVKAGDTVRIGEVEMEWQ